MLHAIFHTRPVTRRFRTMVKTMVRDRKRGFSPFASAFADRADVAITTGFGTIERFRAENGGVRRGVTGERELEIGVGRLFHQIRSRFLFTTPRF